MTELPLPELEAERDRLYAQLSAVGDFRRGSVSENYRKCGKPNCACAQPEHPGHGPRFLWTRTARGRGTVGRQLAAGGGGKGRRGGARHAGVAAGSGRVAGGEGGGGGGRAWGVRVGKRPDRGGERKDLRGRARRWHGCAPGAGGRKRGLCDAIAQEKAAEIGRLAAEAARSLGCGDAGMEAAEAVIRAGMLQAGGGMLEKLLAADPGYRGPWLPRLRAWPSRGGRRGRASMGFP